MRGEAHVKRKKLLIKGRKIETTGVKKIDAKR